MGEWAGRQVLLTKFHQLQTRTETRRAAQIQASVVDPLGSMGPGEQPAIEVADLTPSGSAQAVLFRKGDPREIGRDPFHFW
jgi:hypothetical protein